MHRKQNFEIVFGFKGDTAVLTYFSLFLLPFFLSFLASFFSLAGRLVGFILVGKVFGNKKVKSPYFMSVAQNSSVLPKF